MARTIQEIREEALDILREDYPRAKESMCRLEVFMRTKSKKAVYELRDFLDHLAAIFYSDDIPPDEAEKHVHECRTHLRRCSVEPLEYMAEKGFVELDEAAQRIQRYPFLLSDNPFIKPNFLHRMRDAKACIAKGRVVKTDGEACQWMDKAFWIVEELKAEVEPTKALERAWFKAARWAAVIFAGGILTALAGLLVKKLLGP